MDLSFLVSTVQAASGVMVSGYFRCVSLIRAPSAVAQEKRFFSLLMVETRAVRFDL